VSLSNSITSFCPERSLSDISLTVRKASSRVYNSLEEKEVIIFTNKKEIFMRVYSLAY